jgi:ribonuclease HII
MDKLYPEYGFKNHKGYCTKGHLEALDKYGVCKIHRKSFAPVKRYLSKQLTLNI